MFEQWDEILKNQPGWIEVSIDADLLERAEIQMQTLGTTMEHAVRTLITRFVEHADEMLARKDAGTPPAQLVAELCESVAAEIVQEGAKRMAEGDCHD